jgi:hypothetical protein
MNPLDWMEILDVVHQSNPMNPLDWMEILDVVHQSNPMNPLEECWDPGKVHSFSELWRSLRTV